ncbi:MAG TPA: MotA/TolQ/ExbB proton channel family protein [Tepidisphaeraceae bacterium]|nr:MotA/TolQ/ExbB proton channel family protein [Tepidisphaeraceae bacterium]
MRISLKQSPARASLLATLLVVGCVLVARSALVAQTTLPAAPSTAPAATTSVPEEPVVPPISPLDLFWKAGYFIWPLTACSVLSVAIIIERFIALRGSRVIPPDFLPGLRLVYRDPRTDRDRGIQYCEQHDSPLARMIVAGIRRLPRGYDAAEKAIEDAGGNEALKLRQHMRFLYSLGSVATLLGLIGTIWGMIKAFHVASVHGTGHAEELSAGIYVAMVNTFAGLAVAIVVTIFYYFFIGRIEKLVSEMNDAVNEFGRDIGFDASPTDEAAATATL